MTKEQIKQNAEAYAIKKTLTSTDSFHGMVENYLAGAHSRDEEIECIKNEATAIMDEACALKTELNKLRNPWISVEERLPEEDKDNKGYSVEVIGLFLDGSVCKCYCGIEEGIWFFVDGWTCDRPTHWMPMPKLQTTK